ncbi:MAG: peptidoglycan-binding domain-containing protein, partial [Candidatus Pacebacteria bacterium]|nr:peptidoglycan-binding domain-containing protein [Candidatus Paceibacterota bacterium]
MNYKTKRVVAGVLGLAMAVSMVAAAGGALTALASFDVNLTVGSTGADVTALQNWLIENGFLSIPAATGYFGPLTQSAVAAYQTSVGITPAAGYVGPITRAKLNAGGSVSGNFPAGCTSASGYSSVTGLPCAPIGFPAGCTSASGFSSTTGQPCSGGGSFPAGCTSASGFSTTTGMSCSGGSSGGGSLSGGAGEITVTAKTAGTETTVGEGKEEKVLGMEIEADDNSDAEITSMRLIATVDTDGATRFNRYVDEVKVYMGSKEVGSLDSSDFSRDAAEFTGTISLHGAVVQKGEKVRFYVAFVANNIIDSDDLDNTINLVVSRIRFTDATGAILTNEDIDTDDVTVSFEDATESD